MRKATVFRLSFQEDVPRTDEPVLVILFFCVSSCHINAYPRRPRHSTHRTRVIMICGRSCAEKWLRKSWSSKVEEAKKDAYKGRGEPQEWRIVKKGNQYQPQNRNLRDEGHETWATQYLGDGKHETRTTLHQTTIGTPRARPCSCTADHQRRPGTPGAQTHHRF